MNVSQANQHTHIIKTQIMLIAYMKLGFIFNISSWNEAKQNDWQQEYMWSVGG